MTIRIFVPWIVLAAVLGFALGGSFLACVMSDRQNESHGQSTPRQHALRTSPGQQAQATPKEKEDHHNRDFMGPEWWLVYVSAGLATFTGALFYYTRILARDAHLTASMEFAATHRPKMIVRYFKRLGSTVRLTMANIGDIPGHSYGCRAIVEWLDPRNLPPFIDLALGYVSTGRAFEVGDSEEADIPMPSLSSPVAQGDPRRWIVYGIIDYRSEDGVRHWRTAFCRFWDEPNGRFEKVPDWDYNYED